MILVALRRATGSIVSLLLLMCFLYAADALDITFPHPIKCSRLVLQARDCVLTDDAAADGLREEEED